MSLGARRERASEGNTALKGGADVVCWPWKYHVDEDGRYLIIRLWPGFSVVFMLSSRGGW